MSTNKSIQTSIKENHLNQMNFWPHIGYFCSFHDNGEIKQVIYNNQARAVKQTIPVEKVQDLYKALKKYDDLLYSDECHITLKMGPGNFIDIISKLNWISRSSLFSEISASKTQEKVFNNLWWQQN